MIEDRAVLTGGARSALPDSAFAYIEPGKKVNGKTPDKFRHYPIHDANHVRNALTRIAQGCAFGAQAKPKVLAAAKRMGIEHNESSGRSFESLYPEMRFVNDAPKFSWTEEQRDGEDIHIPHITGYAAVFDKPSRKLGGFVEVVENRAFNNARSEGFQGVVCRYNHRDDMVLGTTGADTLRIEIDERGLKYDVIPPNSRGDVLELVQRGDVRFSSFAFRCNEPGVDDSWGTTEWNAPLRTLHKVELVDVAPVLDPAYFDTSAAARSMTGAVDSLASWVNAEPAEVRSMLQQGQAIRFFKRTDRPSIEVPKPDDSEIRMVDDKFDALFSGGRVPTEAEVNAAIEEAEEVAEEAATVNAATEENAFTDTEKNETRAKLQAQEDLCRRWCHGEPCVKEPGHADDCAGPCWGRVDGVACCKPDGHTDGHEPMSIRTRSAEGETEEAETREAETGADEETRAAAEAFEALKAQAALDEARMMMIKLEVERPEE
jgi:uncharacterized protein